MPGSLRTKNPRCVLIKLLCRVSVGQKIHVESSSNGSSRPASHTSERATTRTSWRFSGPARRDGSGHRESAPAELSLSLCVPQCSETSVRSARGVAASFLTRCRCNRLLRPRRCGDFGFVSRHKPAAHRFLVFPLFPSLRRRVSHAEERLRHQRFLHAESGCEINASHTQGSGCEIDASLTISRRQLVMARPRASRSSSHRDERWKRCRV